MNVNSFDTTGAQTPSTTGANSPNAGEANARVYTVVWDIDDVITARGCRTLAGIRFFSQEGAVLRAQVTQYVFPRIKELFQRLYQEPNIRMAFFSSGSKERGMLLRPQLLELAFGQERAEEIKKAIPILSEEDLEEHPFQEREFDFVIPQGKRKNLSRVTPEGGSLKDVIIIDNQIEYAVRGQEHHFFRVRNTAADFENMGCHRKLTEWTRDGKFSPVAYTGSLQDSIRFRKADVPFVSRGTFIIIYPDESAYIVEFKARGKEECQTARLDSSSPLFEKIARYFPNDSQVGPETLPELYAWIREQGGEIPENRIYHEANKVYYVAGILFTAIERAKRENRPLSQIMLEIQYKWDEATQRHIGQFERLCCEDHWYVRGLEELRKVNSELEFMHPHLYKQIISQSLSAEEEAILKKHKGEEEKGCVIQ